MNGKICCPLDTLIIISDILKKGFQSNFKDNIQNVVVAVNNIFY